MEEAKIKKIDSWSKSEDGVYTFVDATADGNPEIRFVTENTDTTQKDPDTGLYYFDPKTIVSFSFDIAITNDAPANVADIEAAYIVQTLNSDGTYSIYVPEITANGEYQTITLTAETVFSDGKTLADVSSLFSGFIFKAGNINGSFSIKNINVVYAE